MTRFFLDRFVQSAIVLAVMSFVIFVLMGLMPGDPVDLLISADPNVTAEDAARLRELYGLHIPLTERYLNWAAAALQGDLGFSRIHAKPVLQVLFPAIGNTVLLLGASFILSVLIALAAGIKAAISPPDQWLDRPC